jgi:hypothetical protein
MHATCLDVVTACRPQILRPGRQRACRSLVNQPVDLACRGNGSLAGADSTDLVRGTTFGGCSPTLWLQLASLRERDHPEDAIPIYQREAERSIETKHNRGYEDGVGFMAKARALMDRSGRDEEFASYAAEVRGRHKPKCNLMKLLDKKGW